MGVEHRVIDVDELVVRYGNLTAVDHVSFSVAAGEVLALLGPNGAGKTSTVETLEGFRRPSSGQVRVLGLDPIADQVGVVQVVKSDAQRSKTCEDAERGEPSLRASSQNEPASGDGHCSRDGCELAITVDAGSRDGSHEARRELDPGREGADEHADATPEEQPGALLARHPDDIGSGSADLSVRGDAAGVSNGDGSRSRSRSTTQRFRARPGGRGHGSTGRNGEHIGRQRRRPPRPGHR